MNTLNPIGSRPYQNLSTAQQPEGRQARTDAVKNAASSDEVSLEAAFLTASVRACRPSGC